MKTPYNAITLSGIALRNDYILAKTSQQRTDFIQRGECFDCKKTGHAAGDPRCPKHTRRQELDKKAGRKVDENGRVIPPSEKPANRNNNGQKSNKNSNAQLSAMKEQAKQTDASVSKLAKRMNKLQTVVAKAFGADKNLTNGRKTKEKDSEDEK